MNIREMIARQQQLLDAARAAGRGLTREEQSEFDSLQRSIDAARAANPGQPTPKEPETPKEGSRGADDPDAMARAVEQERLRVRSITEIGQQFGMDVSKYVDDGSSVDQVRAAVLDYVREHGAPVNAHATVTDSEQDKFRRAASDALLMRGGIQLEKPAEGAQQLRGMSLRDLAIECSRADGNDTSSLIRCSSDELYSRMTRAFYNPEAAFPAILDQTIEKAYKEGHKKVAVTFDKFTKKGSLSDFKTHDNYYIAGPVGEFLEVPENGELKHDVFKDDKLPTRKLKTYGRQFTLSRKAFVDDDISLVTSIPARYAAAARKTINKQVFEVLMKNPAVYDGKTLFGKDHQNLLKTGTGVTQEALQTMIMALTNQKDQFGEAIIINPGTIVVPSGMQFEMYTLFNSQTINTEGNTQAVNPLYQYRDSIQVSEDPTINALAGGMGNVMPWFLIGDQADTDFIEVDYLNGQEIPNIRRMEQPGTLGFVWDIYLDWGISVMDYRGAVKNPGITVKTKLELA